MNSNDSMGASVRAYCAAIGKDPLLVQGAGGNVSWKEGDSLWIKASGTWLSEAEENDIFVPVDLPHLRAEMQHGNFSVVPKLRRESTKRASIETLLHALMPHKVVAHLHAIGVLKYLVREESAALLKELIGDAVKWIEVDYFKPGADLAHAVAQQFLAVPDADVVFIRSHGVVIGGDSVQQVQQVLVTLLSKLPSPVILACPLEGEPVAPSGLTTLGYKPSADSAIHALAVEASLTRRLQDAWALYPDHVVFLGAGPCIVGINADIDDLSSRDRLPEFVFVPGSGVFEGPAVTEGHRAQLRCYYDVLVRQEASVRLRTLSHAQIADLLDWDAEKYRQQLNKPKSGTV